MPSKLNKLHKQKSNIFMNKTSLQINQECLLNICEVEVSRKQTISICTVFLSFIQASQKYPTNSLTSKSALLIKISSAEMLRNLISRLDKSSYYNVINENDYNILIIYIIFKIYQMHYQQEVVKKQLVDQFILKREIATGLTSVVYEATTLNGETVIIKKFLPEKSNFALPEYTIVKNLNHPYIIRAIDYREAAEHYNAGELLEKCQVLIMQYIVHGELFDLIAQYGPLKEVVARTYFRQLIQALEYIHSNGIAHLDLKLQNLLLDEDFNLKLIDFGLSVVNPNNITKFVGTDGYIAPEIHTKAGYDGFSADIFSAGVILFILLLGTPPFKNATNDDFAYKNISEVPQKFWRVYKYRGLTDNFKHLIQNMLKKDPKQRLTIQQIKKHEWYNGQILSNADLSRGLSKYYPKNVATQTL